MARQAGRNNIIKVFMIGFTSVRGAYGLKKLRMIQRIMDSIPAINPNTIELFRITSTTF